MKLHYQDLPNAGFILMDKLEHKHLIPFERQYLNKRTKISIFYYALNIALFAYILFFLISVREAYSVGLRFSYFSSGLAFALALARLHEYIHVLAFKFVGAENTSYTANFRKFYFMALADKFVVNKKEFRIVALAPFSAISLALGLSLFFTSPLWSLAVLSAILAHTSVCSRDFGLLSYFDFHTSKEIVSYDDVAAKISYFYAREKPILYE